MKVRNVLFIVAAIAIIVLIVVYMSRQPPAPMQPGAGMPESRASETVAAGWSDRDVESHNRAVGLMGRYDFAAAREIFAELADRYPAVPDLQVNLAIATLNRQVPGDEERALAILEAVLSDHPEHLRARYCVGLLKLYLGDPDAARAHFRFIADRDPDDAHAVYYVAQTLMQGRSYDEALQWFDRAIELNPYLRSAYYGRSQTLFRLGRDDEAQSAFDEFDQLKTNPRSISIEFVYTRMGPKAETIALGEPAPSPAVLPEGAVFLDPQPLLHDAGDVLWRVHRPNQPVSITACDINSDGAVDIFITGVLEADGAINAVCLNDGSGRFTLDLDHPLTGIADVNAALWGDFDNDGFIDVYLCRRGANLLMRQQPGGEWENVTDATGTANAAFDTVDGLFFDADHDGDLDIFCVNADGPNELLNNNRDGTFTEIAASQGIAGDGRASRQILAVDFDADRDLDLIVINAGPPHEVYRNDRLWAYRGEDDARFAGAWTGMEIVAAVTGDVDADGQADLFTLSRDGTAHRWPLGESGMERGGPLATHLHDADPHVRASAQLALADVDGDGRAELLISSADGWLAMRIGDRGADEIVHVYDEPELVGVGLIAAEAEHGPGIVGVRQDGAPPLIWNAGPGRHAFAALQFTGMDDAGQAMRSNASGIGTHFAARIGSRWVAGSTLPMYSGPGQSLQPVLIGLGHSTKIDFISIDWSDGVFQSELDLPAGELHNVTETQRQLSSCPVLFAWDGEKYEFVSDVLGVGGLGYALAPGEYAEPRPWERFLFPRGLLKPKDGRYHLKLGEPMEEACYLDAARLVVYDLPPGWSMTIDDRFAIAGPTPTGEPRFYRRFMDPIHAVNDRGEDVTDAIIAADHVAAPPGPNDQRFIGRLADDHVLTVEFPQAIDSHSGHPMLVIDGWVEYPYSQTMFAAWQAGAEYRAPTLEARSTDGTWQVVMEQFGYPAGMPREMSVPLTGLPEGASAVRLHTNQEIYFDRLRVAWAEECPGAVRRPLSLEAATLNRAGFAQRVEKPQRRPHYDYDLRVPFWDTRHQSGFYSQFGPVDASIRQLDGALAIFGPGEEIHFEFSTPSHSAREGWSRFEVLEVEGWCKDLDLFTRDGETLAPLPTQPQNPDAESLHRQLNTRFEAGSRP